MKQVLVVWSCKAALAWKLKVSKATLRVHACFRCMHLFVVNVFFTCAGALDQYGKGKHACTEWGHLISEYACKNVLARPMKISVQDVYWTGVTVDPDLKHVNAAGKGHQCWNTQTATKFGSGGRDSFKTD